MSARLPNMTGPLDADAVAKLIVKFGFLDVDFYELSDHFGVPVNELIEAADGSLVNVLERAIKLALAEFVWSESAEDWPEFLHQYAMSLWDFLRTKPGLARLMSVGVGWEASTTHNVTFMAVLKKYGFSSKEVSQVMMSIVALTISDRAFTESLLSRTGNIAEMYSDLLLHPTREYTDESPFVVGLQNALRRVNLAELDTDFPGQLVDEIADYYIKQSHSFPRQWFEECLLAVIAGWEWQKSLTADGSPSPSPLSEAPSDNPQDSGQAVPKAPADTVMPIRALKLNDVAKMIISYGFLDVDFNKLSRHYKIPASQLVGACNNSLSQAITRAMDLLLKKNPWPVYRDSWQVFMHDNCLLLWDFYRMYPGYARLITNGIMGDRLLSRFMALIDVLSEFGLNAQEISLIFYSTLITLMNDVSVIESSLSATGNIAEIRTEVSALATNNPSSAPGFIPDWESLAATFDYLPPADVADMIDISRDVTEIFMIINNPNDSSAARAAYGYNLRLTIAGLEQRINARRAQNL